MIFISISSLWIFIFFLCKHYYYSTFWIRINIYECMRNFDQKLKTIWKFEIELITVNTHRIFIRLCISRSHAFMKIKKKLPLKYVYVLLITSFDGNGFFSKYIYKICPCACMQNLIYRQTLVNIYRLIFLKRITIPDPKVWLKTK